MPVMTGYALQPLRRRIHFKPSLVFFCIKIVHIEILTGLIIDPGGHIYRPRIWICSYPAALELPGILPEREYSLELQCIAVIDCDLYVPAFAVHKVFHAEIQLIVVYIDVTDMVDLESIALERFIVLRNDFPVAVIFSECPGSANPVIPVLRAYTLSACDSMDIRQLIFTNRFCATAPTQAGKGQNAQQSHSYLPYSHHLTPQPLLQPLFIIFFSADDFQFESEKRVQQFPEPPDIRIDLY